jgi:hypothetical protein
VRDVEFSSLDATNVFVAETLGCGVVLSSDDKLLFSWRRRSIESSSWGTNLLLHSFMLDLSVVMIFFIKENVLGPHFKSSALEHSKWGVFLGKKSNLTSDQMLYIRKICRRHYLLVRFPGYLRTLVSKNSIDLDF